MEGQIGLTEAWMSLRPPFGNLGPGVWDIAGAWGTGGGCDMVLTAKADIVARSYCGELEQALRRSCAVISTGCGP